MQESSSIADTASGSNNESASPDVVYYAPGDCALVIGPGDLLLKRLDAFRIAGLRPSLLCTDVADLSPELRGLRALAGRPAAISGWMGAFHAQIATAHGQEDLAPLSWHADGHFDWVLDFSGMQHPAVPPLGWYSLAADDYQSLKTALLEIACYRREGHSKPRYFRFDPQRCARCRQGISGCQACLSVCPASAIRSGQTTVDIEPHLCQGCGTCALVCPSGAVRHVLPGTQSQLEALLHLNTTGRYEGLWLTGRTSDRGATPAGWLVHAVDQVGSLGMEFWLGALAMGLPRVAIDASDLVPQNRQALSEQVHWTQSLLTGLGLPPALALVEDGCIPELPAMPPGPSWMPEPTDDKRTLLYSVLESLSGRGGRTQAITVPAGPLGEVVVDATRCTLCAACVRLCPSEALRLPGNSHQLAFIEEYCVQCGLCVNACPERAVRLNPRVLLDAEARRAPRVIAEVEPYCCPACGRPFSNKALVARGQALMADHPMFQGENARLMTLCAECRQKAVAGVPI